MIREGQGHIKKIYFERASVICSSIVINLLALALPILILQVYDRILLYHNLSTLTVFVVGACIAICLEAILRICRGNIVNYYACLQEHNETTRTIDHLFNMKQQVVEGMGISKKMEYFLAIYKMKDFYSGYIIIAVVDCIFIVVFIGIIGYLSKALAIIPFICIALFIFISSRFHRNIRGGFIERSKYDEAKYGLVVDILKAFQSIKSFGLEHVFRRQYESKEYQCNVNNFTITKLIARVYNISFLFSQAIMIAMLAVGALMILHDQLTMGRLIASVILAGRLIQPINQVINLWVRYQDFVVSERKLNELHQLPAERRHSFEKKQLGIVQIDDLYFEQDERDKVIIADVNLRLNSGQSVLVTAQNDLQKYSFIKLLMGSYKPQRGSVKIDEIAAADYQEQELIKHIGYLSIDSFLVSGTIRDNLTRYQHISQHKVETLCKFLGIHDDIIALPFGYHTPLFGTGNDSIASDLRHMICVARTMLTKPKVIVYDHAERGFDEKFYHKLYTFMARIKPKTAIIIFTKDNNIASLADHEITLSAEKAVLGYGE